MKKLTLIATLLMALLALQARATDIYTYLAPSETLVQKIQDAQKITFDSNGMNVTTADGTTVSMAFDKFNFFSFTEKIPTGIKAISSGNEGISIDGNRLSVEGASQAAVYNTAGVLVAQLQVAANGTASYDISSLPAGIYIVKATMGGKAQSVKMVRK